jgi:plasmid maintenance system antidote protein VapI
LHPVAAVTAPAPSSGRCIAIEIETETVSLNRDIYPNLKLRMYTTGIRQNRLARMLGIHEASLSRIMNGFREPTGDIRLHLAEILHSDPDWLFLKMQISDDLTQQETQFALHQ